MLRFACDIGGTFTDLVVDGRVTRPRVLQAADDARRPGRGLLDVLSAAAADYGIERRRAPRARRHLRLRHDARDERRRHRQPPPERRSSAPRAIRTSCSSARAAAATRLFDYTQEYPAPYVPRSLTFEIPERILADGTRLTVPSTRTRSSRSRARVARARGRGGRSLLALVDRQSGARAPRRRAPATSTCRAIPSRSPTASTRACASTDARPRPRSTRR